MITYARVIDIKDAVILGSLDELPSGPAKEPAPGEPLDLAMQDYILRHAPGWVVRGGPVLASEDEKLPASVEDQRRELDQQIKDYADRAKVYFGARREP